jgi:alcohol/geraniol dehydrogenase (NADP+)
MHKIALVNSEAVHLSSLEIHSDANRKAQQQKGIPMSTSTQTSNEPASGLKQKQSAAASAVQSGPSFRMGNAMNYKAWIAKATKRPMVLESVDLEPLGVEDVEVAVEYCGLCHSDLSVLNNDWGISQYPAILGHEVVGRVTAIGPNAKGLAVGERVGVGWYSGSCMHCRQCMSGSHHLCPQVQPTIVGHRGGFATHIRTHWAWVIPLPEKLNFAEAGPLLCGGITVFSPLTMYAKPTSRVGIIGIGGLGHMAVKFTHAYGCDVTAFTSSESKFDEAKGFGANHVVSSKDSAAIKKLGGSFDLLISTVNVKLDWDAMIGALAPNGRLHLVGAVLEPIPVSAFSLILQQRSVSGSPTGSPAGIERMLDFASRHNIAPQTEHFPMSNINEAFARLESGKARYRIVLDADF